MKKLYCIVLWCLVVTFGSAASSLAIVYNSAGGIITGTGDYIGGIVNKNIYVGEDVTTDLSLNDFQSPTHQDYSFNVNLILDEYNDAYGSGAIDQIYETYKNDAIGGLELKEGGFALSAGTEFVSIKFDGPQGGWFLWNVIGLDWFSFSGLNFAISHYSQWSTNPVPEPATALLLLAGLLGFAGYKKKFNT